MRKKANPIVLVAPALLLLFAQASETTSASPQESPPTSAESSEAAIPATGLAGDWVGALEVGAVQLRLVLKVEAAADGTLSAVLDSVDQGAKLPVDALVLDGRTLRFSIPAIGGAYEGTLTEAGDAFEGTWSQGGRSLPLTLTRTEEPFELKRPQTPQPPFPYESRDVSFENVADGVTLAGTLLTPEGEGPFPAVLFVTGSGPQDRNESLMGHAPFHVIADHLARHGIASLRYDDRGFGESTGDHLGSTVTDFAEDAAAGAAFLAAQPKIAPSAVGILGHSEGGLAGPHAATLVDEIDFLVLLAPPGVPLSELLQRQGADMMRLQGVDEGTIEMAVAGQADDLALVRDESISDRELQERLRERTRVRIEALGAEEAARLGLTEEQAEQSIAQVSTPWFRSLMRADPATHLRQVEVPVLALFGGKDFQVAAEENATALRAARPDAEVHILPGLNHLFQHAETGGIEEYGQIEETIAPQVLEMVTEWIRARASEPSAGE